ncbi:MAG: hypothetical protein AAGG80_00405 [Pseudomonadota bacterium]
MLFYKTEFKPRSNIYSNGFLLLTVMIYLLLLSMIFMFLFKQIILNNKQMNYAKIQTQLFNQAQATLVSVATDLTKNVSRWVIYQKLNVNLKTVSSAWWQQHAMIKNFSNALAQVVIEKLSAQPCVHITKTNTGSVFYRINVRMLTKRKNLHLVLQAIYAIPMRQVNSCDTQVKTIHAGQQAWTQLT